MRKLSSEKMCKQIFSYHRGLGGNWSESSHSADRKGSKLQAEGGRWGKTGKEATRGARETRRRPLEGSKAFFGMYADQGGGEGRLRKRATQNKVRGWRRLGGAGGRGTHGGSLPKWTC